MTVQWYSMPYVSKTWQNISSSPALKSMYSLKPPKEAQNLDKEREPQIVGSYLLGMNLWTVILEKG